MLGPVDVTGLGSSGCGKRLAEVAAYIYLRPGHTRSDLAYAMSPNTPWGERSVKQRLTDLRGLLGSTADGSPRLSRNARDGALPAMNGVRCAPDPQRRGALEPYEPTAADIVFARRFVDWPDLPHGIQRVGACRTQAGELLLVELEDLNPYPSLNLLPAPPATPSSPS